MSLAGKFIVIEGLEGAGKSTAINTVAEVLKKNAIDFTTTREPGGTEIGEIVRTVIKNPDYNNILVDRSELLLLYTARIQLIEEVIKPALDKGIWIIADRFELSTFAYQGGGRGIDSQWIQSLSAFSIQGFKPDLTLYLDISPELGMQRARTRGQFDRIEQQSIDFFYRVRDTYLHYVQNDESCCVIDASLPLPEVLQLIETRIRQYIE